jgi:hypothetical protein
MNPIDTLAGIAYEAGYLADTEERRVRFKVEGVEYRFELFGDDTNYARLIVGFTIPAGADIDALLTVANEQNQRTKSVKTVVYALPDEGHVSFSIEMFFGEAAAWESVFGRCLAAIRTTSDEYYESLRKAVAAAE